METVLLVHGHNRWLVAAVWGVLFVSLLWARRGWSQGAFRLSRLALAILLVLFAVQFLLGLVLFVWKWQHSGQIPPYRWEHVVVMVAALGLTHLPLRWRKLSPQQWWRRTFWLALAVGALVFVGVSRLPKGWLG